MTGCILTGSNIVGGGINDRNNDISSKDCFRIYRGGNIKMDRAGVESILGRGVRWVDGEDDLDVTFYMDKSIREGGLSLEDECHLKALQALYESGY